MRFSSAIEFVSVINGGLPEMAWNIVAASEYKSLRKSSGVPSSFSGAT